MTRVCDIREGLKFMDVKKLRAKCIEKGMTFSELASSIKVAKSTLYRRCKTNTLTIKNMLDIIQVLSLNKEDIFSIFFENLVA